MSSSEGKVRYRVVTADGTPVPQGPEGALEAAERILEQRTNWGVNGPYRIQWQVVSEWGEMPADVERPAA